MLDRVEIIPEELMNAEIAIRVKCWQSDIKGRLDFSHALNLQLKRLQKTLPGGENEWKKMPADKKKTVIAEVKKVLTDNYAQNLRLSETSSAAVTKELFWKYEKECRLNNYKNTPAWCDWIASNHAKLEKDCQRHVQDLLERSKTAAQKKARKQLVAPLCEVELKLSEAAKCMKEMYHGIELRKNLVKLRKSAMDSGLGPLVSKEVFDKHMENVLAPRVKDLPPEMRALAMELRKQHEGVAPPSSHRSASELNNANANNPTYKGDKESLFLPSKSDAVKRAEMIVDTQTMEKTRAFNKWRKDKLKEAQESEKKRQAERAKAEKEKKLKEKKAKAAFKKWTQLHKDNKYYSKLYGKQDLPVPSKVTHPSRWSKDVDFPLNLE